MNRREFIKKTALAGAAGIGMLQSLDKLTIAAAGPAPAELIVAYNGEPEKLLQTALSTYGGLEKLIKRGGTVLIKANFSWFGRPEQACNTNPALLAALVKSCKKAGAASVRVVDLSIDMAQMCLAESGIQKAVEAAGGEVANLDKTRTVLKNSGVLHKIHLFEEALKAECLINVPILKHHSTVEMTGALKSNMGLTPNRGRMHAAGLDQAVTDLAKLIKPHLHILDAYRVLKTNGPHGPGEVAKLRQLILTHDPVAGDAYGATLLGRHPAYLKMAAYAGLGCMDLAKIKIIKVHCS